MRVIERLFETEIRGFQVRVWCDVDKCPEAKIVYDRISGANMDSESCRQLAEVISENPWVNAVQVRWPLDVQLSDSDFESIIIYNDWP